MLGFHSAQRYMICTVPVDMRKGIDGLCGVVRHLLEDNLQNGYVFIFFNKDRDKVKILVWDHDGYVMYHKRLERGSFEVIPGSEGNAKLSIRSSSLLFPFFGKSIHSIGMLHPFPRTLNMRKLILALPNYQLVLSMINVYGALMPANRSRNGANSFGSRRIS